MVGEVWLASGQSNMSFAIDRPMLNAKQIIAGANFPLIREFRNPQRCSSYPEQETVGDWKVCTPQNAGCFSAVAYFFARKISAEQHVAMGIINSSYDGSFIQPWISETMLETQVEFAHNMQQIKMKGEDWAKLQEAGNPIRAKYKAAIANDSAALEKGVARTDFKDSSWKNITYPMRAADAGLNGYKIIWLRKTVNIPESVAGKPLLLSLGELKQQDITYFNGIEIGRDNKEEPREYRIPSALVKGGKAVIAIRWLSEWGYGRVGNPGVVAALSNVNNWQMSLAGNWKYNEQIEPELPLAPSYESNPSSIYNAMIVPLLSYGLKGFIWYQGEGNTYNPTEYQLLLPLLIKDWRTRWQQGTLPFLFVQLPNLSDGGENWVRFREAQSKVLVANTGLVVTIDVGDSTDLHPKNKQPVGERLALAAMKIAYHKNIIYSGPVYKSFSINGHFINIKFKMAGTGLITKKNEELKGFLIAGGNRQFYPATGRIEGNRIILSSPKVNAPVSVRYDWAESPQGNLYNRSHLPAAPFRTDVWAY